VNILLPYWLGVPKRCFYQEFQEGISEALRELGHELVQFAFPERAPLQLEGARLLYRQIATAKIDLVLDLACWGYGLSRVILPPVDGVSEALYDKFGITYVGWLFDHPFNQQLCGVTARKHYAVYPDLGHSEQVRLIYPDLRLTGEVFAPPAVLPKNVFSAGGGSENRAIDVLYIGNLVADALERQWHGPLDLQRPPRFDPEFCDALADSLLETPDCSLHLCLQRTIAKWGMLPSGFNLRFHVSLVENFLRHLYRRNAVVTLARSGVRMRVIGKGWGQTGLPPNAELAEQTDYEGIFRLAAQAKISLDVSTYLDGANDRVFSYALSKSVCFTNATGYLREALGEDGGMRFYSLQNLPELCEKIKALLAQPLALREAGERARQTVLSAHTWRQRVSSVLSALAP